jgi:hypothetical protein
MHRAPLQRHSGQHQRHAAGRGRGSRQRLRPRCRVVASLEALGYVDRVADPTDVRANLIAVTAVGRATIETLWNERTAGLTARIAKLDADQVAQLDKALMTLELLVCDANTAKQPQVRASATFPSHGLPGSASGTTAR